MVEGLHGEEVKSELGRVNSGELRVESLPAGGTKAG